MMMMMSSPGIVVEFAGIYSKTDSFMLLAIDNVI